jgi:hypothetical protein
MIPFQADPGTDAKTPFEKEITKAKEKKKKRLGIWLKYYSTSIASTKALRP